MAGSRYRNITAGDELQFIVFRVGNQPLALNIFQVARILRYVPPEPLAGAPEFVEGVVHYLDRPVPVFDLRKRLGRPAGAQEETRIMVLELEGRRVAMAVDQVHEALRVDARFITVPDTPPPGVPPEWLGGMIIQPGRTILVLQGGRLLGADEWRRLAEVAA